MARRKNAQDTAGAAEEQPGGLAILPPKDNANGQHTEQISTEDGAAGAVMVLIERGLLMRFHAKVQKWTAREALLALILQRAAVKKKELEIEVQKAIFTRDATWRALEMRRRPQTRRRHTIGKWTSFAIVLGEAGLAFAGAEALLPNLSTGGVLGTALKLAPFGFVIAVCTAAFAAMEASGTSIAEALQRRDEPERDNGPNETVTASIPSDPNFVGQDPVAGADQIQALIDELLRRNDNTNNGHHDHNGSEGGA